LRSLAHGEPSEQREPVGVTLERLELACREKRSVHAFSSSAVGPYAIAGFNDFSVGQRLGESPVAPGPRRVEQLVQVVTVRNNAAGIVEQLVIASADRDLVAVGGPGAGSVHLPRDLVGDARDREAVEIVDATADDLVLAEGAS
jgi:hypothetical protein